MSRSFRQLRHSRRYRPGQWHAFEEKAQRRAVKQALSREVRERDEDPDWLEVLADFHEENGRLWLAEQLRRGRDAAL